MKKAVKLGLMLTLSITALAGCSGNIPLAPSTDANSFFISENGTTDSTAAQDFRGRPGHGKGFKDGPGKAGFGLPAELNLTEEQKAQLEALRPEKPAEKPDMANMEAIRKEISTAFLSDTFDITALKARLEAAKPVQEPDRATAEAERIVKTWNILTAEQRAILETKQAEMAAKVPPQRPVPNSAELAARAEAGLTKLAADLGLSDIQKASLAEIMKPPADIASHEAMHAERKAAQEAINSALKAGNATVESIAAILKANEPEFKKGDELDRLAKIHAILNAEQRAKFIELGGKGPGFGGPGGKGVHHKGGPLR